MIPFAKFFHHNKRISGIEWVMLYKNSFYQNIPNVKDTCITKKHAIPMELRAVFWSCLLDSNQRPLPYQGSALPTELKQHFLFLLSPECFIIIPHLFENVNPFFQKNLFFSKILFCSS